VVWIEDVEGDTHSNTNIREREREREREEGEKHETLGRWGKGKRQA
jgi:hypothetical protein